MPIDPNKSSLMLITRLVTLMNNCSGSFSAILTRCDTLTKFLSSDGSSYSRNKMTFQDCLILLSDIESFENNELKDANEAEEQAVRSGLVIEVRTSTKILRQLEGSTKKLILQVTLKIATSALHRGYYALSCDLSRSWIKKQPEQIDVEGTVDSTTTDTTDYHKREPIAVAYITRALSFAGMGCPYMSNVHAIKAEKIFPQYPNIASLLSRLDNAELNYFQNIQETCLVDLVGTQVYEWMNNVQSDRVAQVDPHNISVETLNALLPVSTSVASKNSCNDLYMTDGATSVDSATVSGISSISLQSALDMWSSLVTKYGTSYLARTHLLQVLHEGFYQAQLLFMEEMSFSAEIKYLSVTFLCCIAFASNEMNNDSNITQYLSAVQVACMLNAAVCRTRRCAPTKGSHPQGAQVSSIGTPQSRELVTMLNSPSITITALVCEMPIASGSARNERSALELCHTGLGIDVRSGPVFLSGYLRAIEVHEICKHYETALQLLDTMEQHYEGVDALAPWGGTDPTHKLLPFVARYDMHRVYSQNYLSPLLTLKIPTSTYTTTSSSQMMDAASRKKRIESSQLEVVNAAEKAVVSEWISKIRDRLKFKIVKYPNRSNMKKQQK
jgi:hypothetical protein